MSVEKWKEAQANLIICFEKFNEAKDAERIARLIVERSVPLIHLTLRQKQVLTMVRLHKQDKEISNELHIAVRTVKWHVSALLQKFDVIGREFL